MTYSATFTYSVDSNTPTDLTNLKQILELYFYTFLKNDNCVLEIVADLNHSNLANLSSWVDFAKKAHKFDNIPNISITDTPSKNSISLNDTILNPYLFYKLFREHQPDSRDYEDPITVEAYNTNAILSRKIFEPDFHGSSFIQSYAPLLSYLNDHPKQFSTFLDVGCGAGAMFDCLRRLYDLKKLSMPLYHGLDFSRNQVLRAQSNFPNGHFRFGTAHKLDFADNSFDIVSANSVLNFIPNKLKEVALNELIRVHREIIWTSCTCSGKLFYKAAPLSLTAEFFLNHPTDIYLNPYVQLEDTLKDFSEITFKKSHRFIAYNPRKEIQFIPENNKMYKVFVQASQNAAERNTNNDFPDITFENNGIKWTLYECFEYQIHSKVLSPKLDTNFDVYSLFK